MQKEISIIGVPTDLGQTRRGVDMGPSAIRYAGIVNRLEGLGHLVYDLGNVDIDQVEKGAHQQAKLRNLTEVIQTSEKLAQTVANEIAKNRFPLVLGGDHSIAIGTIAGVSSHYNQLGVLWFDAHGDMNTVETTPSGNIHGMPLAVNLGYGHERLTNIFKAQPKLKPENLVLMGVRDLDPGEKALIRQLNIKTYTMHEIDRYGIATVMDEAISYLQARTDGVHLSFDLDGLDPADAPGVGTPVSGGVTYREGSLALEMLAHSGIITSAEFVEVNPMLDDKSKTAEVAVALIGSLLGERLL